MKRTVPEEGWRTVVTHGLALRGFSSRTGLLFRASLYCGPKEENNTGRGLEAWRPPIKHCYPLFVAVHVLLPLTLALGCLLQHVLFFILICIVSYNIFSHSSSFGLLFAMLFALRIHWLLFAMRSASETHFGLCLQNKFCP